MVTRNGPLAFYRGPDDMPEGPEYELARRFADELGVKLKITPVRTYAEIYAALASGHAHLAAAGLKVPSQKHPGNRIRPCVPAGARAFDLPPRRGAAGLAG